MPKINCAIYTRKSTEEGLEQEFNSLDNQYESAKSYIESQKHEGWRFYKRYDDGGYSGGNTERPAFKQLMADIEKGYVKCIVVYKVDRLSRSLADFSKMMEIFEKHEVSFVSITQHFNTSNSMGKLTLNILLSFAQFEREVTAERIKDKIFASKSRGIWMGGNIPFGYRSENKKLIIEEEHATKVKCIFGNYLKHSSIVELKNHLNKQGYRTKNNKLWSNGVLGRFLRNPTYIGKTRHKHNIYDGEHEAIINEDLWNKVQEKLNNKNNRNNLNVKIGKYLLFKKLYTSEGELFKCDACVKNNGNKKVRYEYYISNSKRFKAEKIDNLVINNIKKFLSVGGILSKAELDELHQINISQLTYEDIKLLSKKLISKIIYNNEQLKIEINRESLTEISKWQDKNYINNELKSAKNIYLSSDEATINIIVDVKSYRPEIRYIDNSLLTNIAKGYQYKRLIETGKSVTDISKLEKKQDSYISRILKLGYLNPKIIEQIIKGNFSEDLTVAILQKTSDEICWKAQEKMIQEYLIG